MTGATAAGPLSVAIDFRSPHAYFAIEPTCALADELGIAVDWQPFLVAPSKKRQQPRPDDDRGTRHRRFRSEYAERDIARNAAARGLEIRNLYRQTDSKLAAIGLLWTKRGPASLVRAYIERVFERHWREALDIEDGSALRALLAEIGAPVSGFEAFVTGEGSAALERLQSELLEAGVIDVPAYRLEGEVFHGRQHLPMIRWLLSGRAGEPPI